MENLGHKISNPENYTKSFRILKKKKLKEIAYVMNKNLNNFLVTNHINEDHLIYIKGYKFKTM